MRRLLFDYHPARYKQAEERLEQQFDKLKTTNEQLRQAIAGYNQLIQESEVSCSRPIGNFGK